MKINERTLMNFSTSTSSPVDKEGILWKRGEVNRNFQKRYFVLRGNLLFYFERKGDKEPVGVIILEGCIIELAEEEQEKFAFKIAFTGDGKRTYILGAETQDVMEAWMKVLSTSSYDYMKLMVLELQQQLADLEEVERVSGNPSMTPSVNMNGCAAAIEPSRPPRSKQQQQLQQRVNPFFSEEQAAVQKPKKSWAQVHREAGHRIVRDREKWCKDKLANEAPLIDLAS